MAIRMTLGLLGSMWSSTAAEMALPCDKRSKTLDEEKGGDGGGNADSLPEIGKPRNLVVIIPVVVGVGDDDVAQASLPSSEIFFALGQAMLADLRELKLDLIDLRQNLNPVSERGVADLTQSTGLEGEIRGLKKRIDSIEDLAQVLKQDLDSEMRNWVKDQEKRIQVLENTEDNSGGSKRWKNALRTFNGLSRLQQFLVLFGMITLGLISCEVAAWAFPYVVNAVINLSSRFKRLRRKAREYLTNINFSRLLRYFVSRRYDCATFADFLSDPLVQQMQIYKYPGTVYAFLAALVQCIRCENVEGKHYKKL